MSTWLIIELNSIPPWLLYSGGFFISMAITLFSVPTIVLISRHKKLYDIPNGRASHNGEIPVLGGIAIFSGFIISSAVFGFIPGAGSFIYIAGGAVILFFLGLKDDLLVIDPRKKFIGQVFASALIVIIGDVRILSFYSVFGIGELSWLLSVLFTVFFFLTLINGYNLIDGVDGLASGSGILVSLFYAVCFWVAGNTADAVLSLTLAGSLAGYFWYNVFGKNNKVFMGDTGAMLIGFVIAYLSVKFIAETENGTLNFVKNPPAIAFALLIVPLFDTLRIIIIRIIRGRSPFIADNNHIHHTILKLGFSHLTTTLVILSAGILILLLAFLVQPFGNTVSIIVILSTSAVLSSLPLIIRKQFR